MTDENVSSGSGRTTPDESVIVTVSPPDELPKPVTSWTSRMSFFAIFS